MEGLKYNKNKEGKLVEQYQKLVMKEFSFQLSIEEVEEKNLLFQELDRIDQLRINATNKKYCDTVKIGVCPICLKKLDNCECNIEYDT